MIVLLGSSHKSAPVAVRERLAWPPAALPDALRRLVSHPNIGEAMIVSTCNRVEILAQGPSDDGALAAIRSFLSAERGIDPTEIERYTYSHRGNHAVKHLFSVTSGLDSMILGEPQIAGQVKQAWLEARRQGATGPLLDRLLSYCLGVSKRVRTETGISRNAVSVAFAAVELGRTIFGDLRGRKALLLGAGKMSSLVARHLSAKGVADILVASRSYTSAAELAEEAGGRALHWEEGLSHLADVDIVVSCTHSSHYVLSRDDVAAAVRRRRGQPLFLIDIAVPRDIDPRANELDNVYLYDIDGLQGVVDSNREDRRRSSEDAERLIARETEAFDRWRQSQAVTPLIVALRETLHGIANSEVQRVQRHSGPLGTAEREALDELARSIIQKVLHRPIRYLRGAVERGDIDTCESIYRQLFGIAPSKSVHALPVERPEDAEEDSEPESPAGPRLIQGGKDG